MHCGCGQSYALGSRRKRLATLTIQPAMQRELMQGQYYIKWSQSWVRFLELVAEVCKAHPRRLIEGKLDCWNLAESWLKGCGDQPEGAEKLGTEQWVLEGAIQERLIEGKLMEVEVCPRRLMDSKMGWSWILKDIENHLVGARSCPRRLIEGKLGCWEQAVGERRPVTGTQLCSRLIRAWPQTAGVARELKHKVDHDNGFGIFAC